MKITLTKAELRNACAGLAKIIPSKTGIAVLGCVRFYVEGGDLKAQATDLDQTLVFRFDCAECEGGGEIIAGFPMLRELSKGAGTVSLEQDGDKVMVTNVVGGHAVTSTAEGMDPRDWPESGAEIARSGRPRASSTPTGAWPRSRQWTRPGAHCSACTSTSRATANITQHWSRPTAAGSAVATASSFPSMTKSASWCP